MPPLIENPSDCELQSEHHDDDNSVKTAVFNWLSKQAVDFYDNRIQKLVVLYDLCLNIGGNYVKSSVSYSLSCKKMFTKKLLFFFTI